MRKAAELTCRQVNAFLAAYLADELATRRRTRFEDHLAVCPDCRSYLAQYEATRILGRAAFDADADASGVPEDLVQAILAAQPREGAATDAPPPCRRPR